jgi:putative RNA 2'-phosphotransferase
MDKHKSIELAFLLRHDKNYKFDEHGWREVDDLLKNHGYTLDMLEDIVENNEKKRYEFSEDKRLIRARQGHSINVDVELEECIPPEFLFHGTSEDVIDKILEEGIKKQSRLYVHLSDEPGIAKKVGDRHGKSAVLVVESGKMSKDGIKFYLSRNNVWLTDYVDPKYIL